MKPITNDRELEERALEAGLLPFFRCPVAGLSMEEITPREYWFTDGVEGPWEWRMAVAQRGQAIYGKFFRNKAGFIARELMPDFCNFRREGYDFDTRYELGLATEKCRRIMTALQDNGSLRSADLRKIAGFGGRGDGFDGALTRLMMQGYVAIDRFEYALDKSGKPYGWGLARYALLDDMLGEDMTRSRYDADPAESLEVLLDRMAGYDREAVRNLLM